MEVLRVQAALLRSLVPDLVLRQGMQVVVSVAERAGARGIIVLAGSPLAAELPESVQAGDVLRLRVAEVTPDRVVLRIVEQPGAMLTPPSVAVPLPGGQHAHITVDERDARPGAGGEDAAHELRLSYESPALGALGLHFVLDAGGVRIAVSARAGAPFDVALDGAAALREAVAEATGGPAQVSVSPRHDPFDAYA